MMTKIEKQLLKDENNAYGFIYITTNLINGKKYIGQKVFDKYWKSYLGSGIHITRAIKKYGKENFIKNIIAIAYSKEELNELEKEFIKNYNAVENDDYYNISCGGESGMFGIKHSEESKQKMSEAHIGKKLSDETKRKLSEITSGEKHYLYGKHPSEKTREKQSEAHKGEKNYNYGKERSEKTKQKISKTEKGKKVSEETKLKQSEVKRGNKHHMYGKKQPLDLIEKRAMSRIKLNLYQIKEIRDKYITGEYSQRKLAKEYSVSQSIIGRIINKKGFYNKLI